MIFAGINIRFCAVLCKKNNISIVFRSIDDALQCSSDIIDNDCGMKEGRDKFDSWLRGLRAVYYSLCGKDRLAILGKVPHSFFPINIGRLTID